MPEGTPIERPIIITWQAQDAIDGLAAMQSELDAINKSLLAMGESGTAALSGLETRLGGISTSLAGIVTQANAAASALERVNGANIPFGGGGGQVPVVPVTGTISAGGETVSSGILVSQVQQIEEERLALSRLAQDALAKPSTGPYLMGTPGRDLLGMPYAPITEESLNQARAGAGFAGPYGSPQMNAGAFSDWWDRNLTPPVPIPPQVGSVVPQMGRDIGSLTRDDLQRMPLTQLWPDLEDRLRYEQTGGARGGITPSMFEDISKQAPQAVTAIDQLTNKTLSWNQAMGMISNGAMTWREVDQGLAEGWIQLGAAGQGAANSASNYGNVLGRLEFSMLRMIVVYGLFFQAIQTVMAAEKSLVDQELEYQKVAERTAYVTGQSVEAAGQQVLAAGALATQYGQPATEGYQVQLQAARIAPGDADAQKQLADAALQLSTITGAPASESIQRLISIEREWGMTASDSTKILDLAAEAYKTTNVDVNAFIDTLAKGSATGQAYGLSLQQMAGYMAAFAQATGSADPSRATQFFDAITQITESSAKQKGLEQLGIAIFDLQGNMLPLPEILDQIAAKWDTWNAEQQTSAAILLVNRRYAQDFFAMMQQYELVSKNVGNFTTEQGQANQMLDNTNKLLEFQIARVKEVAWNDLTQGLLQAAGGAERLAQFLGFAADHAKTILALGAYGVGLPGYAQGILARPPAPQPGDENFIGPVRPTGAAALPYPNTGPFVNPPPYQPAKQDYDWLNRVNLAEGMFTSVPSVDQTKLSYDQLLVVEQQANDKAQQMVQIFAQQAAASQGLGNDQKAIDAIAAHITEEYKNHVVYLQSVDGRLVSITGLASQYANELTKASSIPPPGLSVLSQQSSQQLAANEALANQMAQQYIQTIQSSNIPLDQQQSMLQQINDKWAQTYQIVMLTNGQMVMLTGSTAAFLGQAEQAANALKQMNPTIESDPQMNAARAGQLQQYLTQYENTLRNLGVQQTPQEYLIFGQNGQLFQFYTSSQAMTLAMDLLRQEIAKNTDTQLRGHYNIPGDFGYQAPTPWEFYARTGSTQKGPVNYPWDFPGDKNPSMGFPATGITDSLLTTFGAPNKDLAGSSVHLDLAATKLEAAANSLMYGDSLASREYRRQHLSNINPDLMYGDSLASQEYMRTHSYGGGDQNSLVALADQFSKQYGIQDPNILRALIQAESGWNPKAIGDSGNSIGLLQLNMAGGAGTGYTQQQLMNPSTNLSIMMPEIAAAVKEGMAQGLTGAALARFVGATVERPAAGNEQNYYVAYGQVLGQYGSQFTSAVTQFNAAVTAFDVATNRPVFQTPQALLTSIYGPNWGQAGGAVGAGPNVGPMSNDPATMFATMASGGGGAIAVQGMEQSVGSLASIQGTSSALAGQLPPLAMQQLSLQASQLGMMGSMIGLLAGIFANTAKPVAPPVVNVTVTGQAGGGQGTPRTPSGQVFGVGGTAPSVSGGAGGVSLPFIRP